jgi:hypothetical protein
MFSPPRFIAIDNREDHLRAITRTLQEIGTPCFGIHYAVENPLDKSQFQGVRCLFMDLHLTIGIPLSDENLHYAIIADILEQNISPTGGPFILIVWTEHPNLCDGLRTYLDTHLDDKKAHARPLAVLDLSKEDFIIAGDGTVIDPAKLREKVQTLVASIPQLAVLLEWETDVLAAAGHTLSSLLNLIPNDKRASGAYSAELDTILSRLACAAVGKAHVAADPRAAVVKSLVPILADRIVSQNGSDESRKLWGKAVTKHESDGMVPGATGAGEINRMLHLAIPGTQTLSALDWGAVVTFPFEWSDADLTKRFGVTIADILSDELKIKDEDRAKCTPVLVRIGAACDFAQAKKGPVTFLLGISTAVKPTKKLPASIWKSPSFSEPGSDDVFHLYVNSRMLITVPPEDCKGWSVLYRIREQLLMQLITTASNHAARPGIVNL